MSELDNMTVMEAYRYAADKLKKNQEASAEALEIISVLTGFDKSRVFIRAAEPFTRRKELVRAVNRRLNGEPLAYILKRRSFYGYDFYVDYGALIPRYDSERLVEAALEMIKSRSYTRVLDLCSGSGCLGITLRLEAPEIDISFSDISPVAKEICEKNALNLLKTKPVHYVGDLYMGTGETFDLIVCNPPYIDYADYDNIEDQVKKYEPEQALFAGRGGYEFYFRIAAKAKKSLKKGGALILETGDTQSARVSEILSGAGFRNVRTGKDLADRNRFVCGDI